MEADFMKKIIISALIVILVIVVLGFMPFRRNISTTLSAQITYDISGTTFAEAEIKIDGEYTFYLFREDRFVGKIEISSFPETTEKNVDIKLSASKPSHLIYRSYLGAELQSMSFGYIKADLGMKNIVIVTSKEDGSINLNGDQVGAILTGNATLKDASNILDYFMKRSADNGESQPNETGFPAGEIQQSQIMYSGEIYYYFATGFNEPLPDGYEFAGNVTDVDNIIGPTYDFCGSRVDVGQEIYSSETTPTVIYVKYENGYARFSLK